MDFSQPHAKEPTPEDLKKLEHLKQMIERAVADGVITGQEIEVIKREILRSSKGSADQLYRELELYDNLVTQKLRTDELEYGGA